MEDNYPYTRTRDIVAKDVAQHELTIIMDNPDSYRHLRFRRPDTSFYWFDIITWPGVLCINGDCGTFVFSRVRDMLTFFRAHPEGPSINPSYWSEKLQAPKRRGGSEVEHFSLDVFNRSVEADITEWTLTSGLEREFKRYDLWDDEHEGSCIYPLRSEWEFRTEFAEHMEYVDEYEHELRRKLIDFKFDDRHPFDHTWENSYETYDYQFLWCCWAIVYGIQMYDEWKAWARHG